MELANEGISTSKVDDGVLVVTFERGRIRDEREILKTLQSLCRYAESQERIRLLLDMGNIQYLSSAGLGVLIGLLKKVRSGDGVLKLCSLREPIQEIFQVMRLDKIFEIFPHQKAALEAF